METERELCVHGCGRPQAHQHRGLCRGCYMDRSIRVRYAKRPTNPQPTEDEVAVHAMAADLELLAAMLTVERSGFNLEQWQRLLATFPPRIRRVVILHGLHQMPFEAIGERVGVSSGRADQLWRSAMPKLGGWYAKLRHLEVRGMAMC